MSINEIIVFSVAAGTVVGFIGGIGIGWSHGFEAGHKASEEINLKIFEKALIEKVKNK
jgi:hypothetical protein